MLGHHFNSPLFAIGFVVVVVYLVGLYFSARERAKVAQMRGRKRFKPDWNQKGGTGTAPRHRSLSRHGGFSPEWHRRKPAARPPTAGTSAQKTPTRGTPTPQSPARSEGAGEAKRGDEDRAG